MPSNVESAIELHRMQEHSVLPFVCFLTVRSSRCDADSAAVQVLNIICISMLTPMTTALIPSPFVLEYGADRSEVGCGLE
jgi:hypothetical protein